MIHHKMIRRLEELVLKKCEILFDFEEKIQGKKIILFY